MDHSSSSKANFGNLVVSPTETGAPIVIGADAQNDDGAQTIRYLSGQKCLQCTYRDGQLHGPLTVWFDSGQTRQEATHQHGALHGPFRLWHENGQLAVEGQYVKGVKTGLWRKWDQDGKLVSEIDRSRPRAS